MDIVKATDVIKHGIEDCIQPTGDIEAVSDGTTDHASFWVFMLDGDKFMVRLDDGTSMEKVTRKAIDGAVWTETWNCTKCHTEVTFADRFCSGCGRSFTFKRS